MVSHVSLVFSCSFMFFRASVFGDSSRNAVEDYQHIHYKSDVKRFFHKIALAERC